MRIAITGHTGLVGSNLYNTLSKDYKVWGLSRSSGYDLKNHENLDQTFQQIRPDVVYHLAANAAESRGQIAPLDMTQNNLMIFLNTLKASINAGVKKFVYTSSVAVYGEATIPYKEDGPTIPKDVYGVNKLAAEQILKIMAKVYGFDYMIFRPHNIYGPGQNMSDPYRNVVALFMRLLMEGKTLKLYGEGKMRRAFSFVDDVVRVLADASDPVHKNLTVNVGSTDDISIKELVDYLQEVTGIEANVELVPARSQEISMFLADHELQDQSFHYQNTPIKLGLRKTWEWAQTQKLLPVIKKKDEICLDQK